MTTPPNTDLREQIYLICRNNKEYEASELILALFQAHQQELLTELLGEANTYISKEYYVKDGKPHAMATYQAVPVSVIQRLINTGKLDSPNPPIQNLDKSVQNKTNDGGRNGG